jgi:adhesin/invasin
VTGGGSVAPTTGTTDANGLASATRTLGPNPGSGTTTATATIGGTPRTVTFSVTAALAGPAQIVKVEGDNQSAQAGATLPVALRVQVLDALSAPVPNVTVTFTTPNGGSFPSGASVQTDGNGFASATWQLGNTAGAQTAQAAVGGPAPAVFSATALAGPISASQSSIAANPTTITAGGAGTTVTVTARDASGNPVSGATVVLSVTGTTGLIQPAGPTNANGQATGSYSSTVAGPKTVSATVGGTAVSQTATVTVQAAAAASIAAVTPLNFSVRFNQAVSTVPRVKVTDQFNNPVAGVAVTFAVTKGVSSLTGTNPATTGANGEATLGAWTITAVNPIFNTDTRVENRLRASATGLTGNPITFIGTVNPVSFGSDLMPIFNSCNSCHSHSFDAGGNATNTRTSLLNSAGYVVPGDSTKANNFILSYPQSGGHSGGNPGSDLMTIIAAWIKQGATQNQPPTYPRP